MIYEATIPLEGEKIIFIDHVIRDSIVKWIRFRSFLLDLVALTPLDLLQFIIGVTPLLR